VQPIIAVLSWYTATTTDDIPGWLLGDISTEWILSVFYGSGEIDESMAATAYHARNTVIIHIHVHLLHTSYLCSAQDGITFFLGLCGYAILATRTRPVPVPLHPYRYGYTRDFTRIPAA